MNDSVLNPFILDLDNYKRNIDPVTHYIEQTASFLSIKTRRSYEECHNFVKRKILDKNNNVYNIKNPQIEFFSRQENGDRELMSGTLLGYLYRAIKEKSLIAPSMTTYINPSVKQSLLVSYIDSNVKGRSKAKKEEFAARAAKNTELAKFKNTEQTNRKLANNAISGAHVSQSTPLANKTAHSTLTSNCRSTSGYGNANNEKLLTGNRHYHTTDVTINNIVSIITHTDYELLGKVLESRNIHIPTFEETMDCVLYSSKMYWSNKKYEKEIRELIYSLNDQQRASFVYTGDLYHFRKYNDKLVRDFFDKLSTKIIHSDEYDYLSYIKSSPEDWVNLAHQICQEEMKGKGKKYEELPKETLKILAATIKNIRSTLEEYSDIIKVIMVTDNMPASVAYFPESVRRSALTSDTDSTIFTVEEWVKWFSGNYGFSDKEMSVAACAIFIASQAITHILAKMSANFGIEKKRLFQIGMKNEFKFDVFIPTNVAKHYFADISCQEGNVFEKHDTEIKGVHLKSSNSPKSVNKKANELMKGIMNDIRQKGSISIIKILKEIADFERSIITSIRNGSTEYFRLGEIKTASSYIKSEDESPFVYHKLWNEVFSKKYGSYGEPPYQVVRLSTILVSPTSTKLWLDSLQDKELSKDMQKWLAQNDKDKLPSILIPKDALVSNGMPEEIMQIIDIRKIVFNLCRIFYIILETLGFYMSNDNITRLVSDQY